MKILRLVSLFLIVGVFYSFKTKANDTIQRFHYSLGAGYGLRLYNFNNLNDAFAKQGGSGFANGLFYDIDFSGTIRYKKWSLLAEYFNGDAQNNTSQNNTKLSGTSFYINIRYDYITTNDAAFGIFAGYGDELLNLSRYQVLSGATFAFPITNPNPQLNDLNLSASLGYFNFGLDFRTYFKNMQIKLDNNIDAQIGILYDPSSISWKNQNNLSIYNVPFPNGILPYIKLMINI